MLVRRLPVLAAAVSGVLAVLLGVAAVLLAGQTAPTEPAAAARAHATALLDAAVRAAGLGAGPVAPVAPVALLDDPGACPWLGIPGLPASRQVRPAVEVTFPLPADPRRVLDAVAGVGRSGYQVDVRVERTLVLRAQAPCVWPAGQRQAG